MDAGTVNNRINGIRASAVECRTLHTATSRLVERQGGDCFLDHVRQAAIEADCLDDDDDDGRLDYCNLKRRRSAVHLAE